MVVGLVEGGLSEEVAAYGFPATQLETQTGVGSHPAGWSSISLLTQHYYCVAWVGAVFPKTRLCLSFGYFSTSGGQGVCVSLR